MSRLLHKIAKATCPDACTSLFDQLTRLKAQYSDLSSQFHGSEPADPTNITSPNDPALSSDFSAAASRRPSKSVRFTDNPSDSAPVRDPQSRYTPYRDDPSEDEPPDHSELTNQQIHEYHQNVLRDQDEQLDRLGESIGRQRDLSIQIGNELDDHAMLLDEVDERVDRHQSQLDRAGKRLTTFARKAKENWSLTVIVVLIVTLVLLIAITK
jgi:syntaxin 8